jgi:hypothetical protein
VSGYSASKFGDLIRDFRDRFEALPNADELRNIQPTFQKLCGQRVKLLTAPLRAELLAMKPALIAAGIEPPKITGQGPAKLSALIAHYRALLTASGNET